MGEGTKDTSIVLNQVIKKYIDELIKPMLSEPAKKQLENAKIRLEIQSNDKQGSNNVLKPSCNQYSNVLEVKECTDIDLYQPDVNFTGELEGIRDLYLYAIRFVIFNDERIRMGYVKNLEDGYFESSDTSAVLQSLNLESLLGFYVCDYLSNAGLPEPSLITALSAEQYEGSKCETKIVFTQTEIGKTKIKKTVQFTQSEKHVLSEENLRIVRKLMEIGKGTGIALCAEKENEQWKITGLTHKIGNHDYVEFKGYLSWTFYHEEKEIFGYYKGRYYLNTGDENEKYKAEIPDNGVMNEKKLHLLVEKMVQQKHGASAIIFAGSEGDSGEQHIQSEIERLSEANKAIPIKAFDYIGEGRTNTRGLYHIGLTNIDGAIFLDEEGMCHGIGVIVDGKTVVKGDVGRGARYNSVKNYLAGLWGNDLDQPQIKAIGVVVSEDGMVDVIGEKEIKKSIREDGCGSQGGEDLGKNRCWRSCEYLKGM